MAADEIDAALQPIIAKQGDCDEALVIVSNSARAGYRAGMREAAKIARLYEWSRAAAVHIERAAGGEG